MDRHLQKNMMNYFAEDDVLAVQPFGGGQSDEELAAVRIWAWEKTMVLFENKEDIRNNENRPELAMLRNPSPPWRIVKFSSANLLPYLLMAPIPLPETTSPPATILPNFIQWVCYTPSMLTIAFIHLYETQLIDFSTCLIEHHG